MRLMSGVERADWWASTKSGLSSAVHIAARIGALATAEEILVSSTLHDLVIGSGIEFIERGEHDLKGVPGPWKLFAVGA